ncbi:MAG: hypothetical protein HRU34_01805 [Richelia sp.]|nr:hypothetical protein [Richelia sp.]CDN09655.1 hypothetical protein RintRC_1213 [Richelia intracellularis]
MAQINQKPINSYPQVLKYIGYLGLTRIGKGQRKSLPQKEAETSSQPLLEKSCLFFFSPFHTQLKGQQSFPKLIEQQTIVIKKPGFYHQKLYSHISIALTTFAAIFSCIITDTKMSVGVETICNPEDTVSNFQSLCYLSSPQLASTQLKKNNELANNMFVYFGQENISFDRYTNKISFDVWSDFFSVHSFSDLQKINFLSCEDEKVSCVRNYTYLPLKISQANPQQNITRTTSQANNPPPLEGQPNLPTSSPRENSPLTPPLNTREDKIERLRRSLPKQKQSPNLEESQPEESQGELGILKVRQINDGSLTTSPPPLEQPSLPKTPKPERQAIPAGYFLSNVGYFAISNIFSAEVDPLEDSLFYAGLTLASAPIRLGKNTILNGSIDGYLIRYINQSEFSYNQIRLNLKLYQQLTSQMYGGIGWSHQNLFYAGDGPSFSSGDRFLKENSFTLSLSRRDSIAPKLVLDSFYEFRYSIADPENRNRAINSLWLSLKYFCQKPLQVGLNYQFNFSDFTKRYREDSYHRLYGNLTYALSKTSNINLQGGVALGDSTDNRIDFDGWFFSINYDWELGRF